MKQQQLEKQLDRIGKAYRAYRFAYQNKVSYENAREIVPATMWELHQEEARQRGNLLDVLSEVYGDA